MDEVKYPIRAASQITGLSSDNIRSWERRYNAITPQRVKGGRLYTEDDIQRLKLLKRAVDHGHSIGQIARLSDDALGDLPIGKPKPLEALAHGKDKNLSRQIDQILAFVEEFDPFNADRALSRLGTLLQPRDFVLAVVVPLMERVGEAWRSGRLGIAQEHLISATLRSVLGT